MSSKLIGVASLIAVLAASSAQAQPRKKGGRGKGRSTTTPSAPRFEPVTSPPPSLVSPPPPPPAESKATPAPAAPVTQAPPEDSPANDSDPSRRMDILPLVAIGVEALWEGRVYRHIEYTAPNVRRYDARGYPSLALAAELFPLAHVSSKFLRGFGVTLRYARAFGFQSTSARLGAEADLSSGLPVDTHFSRYAAGLRYRIALNPESRTPFVLATSASLCGWNFDFGPELPRGPDIEVPTAAYRMVRFGFDGALEVRPVTFYAALSYLHAFSIVAPSSRQLDSLRSPHLPTAVGMGVEVRGALGVRLVRWLALRLSLEYGILAFNLRALEGRADQPARVLDSYLSAGFGPYATF